MSPNSENKEKILTGMHEAIEHAKGDEDVLPEPPTIEIPFGEALEVLMNKPEYTDQDIRVLAMYARKRRQDQAARELRLVSEAAAKADKKAQKEAKAREKASKKSEEAAS